jgi:uncharacterized lipoprotein YmbA
MRVRTAVLLAAVVAVPGCISLKHTPEARFFVLRPVVEAPVQPLVAAPSTLVAVLPARLPDHLERPQIVTWAASGELRIDEFVRWGEPLDAGVTRTLEENLELLLPEYRLLRGPWRATGEPHVRVATELRSFGLQPSGEVRLEGLWTLLPAGGERPLARGDASLGRGPLARSSGGGVDPATEVEAMSELVGELSRTIAAAIRSLPPAEPPPAPRQH